MVYRQVLSEALIFSIGDRRLGAGIVIERVEITDDLSKADIFFSSYDPVNKNKVVKAFYSAVPLFFSLLKKKVKIKQFPKMKFHYDQKQKEADRVIDLIEDISSKEKSS